MYFELVKINYILKIKIIISNLITFNSVFLNIILFYLYSIFKINILLNNNKR